MSDPTTCAAMRNATSSPESADGPMPSSLWTGPQIGACGPAHALANLSARQAKAMGLLTSATFGPPGTTSSSSAALQSSLGSRLRQRLGTAGLIEQSVTWRESATPAGLRYFRRAAQTRSISVTGCGSLPTPSGTSNHGKNHVAGRLDEWGGSSNPFRRGRWFAELGSTHSPGFELWVMGFPASWRRLMPPATRSSRRSRPK